MIEHTSSLIVILQTAIFASAVLMHLVRKNSSAVWTYAFQSWAIALLMLVSAEGHMSALMMIAVLATLAVKGIAAPYFFTSLIKRHQLTFSSSTYLNTPVTLTIIAALVALTHSGLFQPLVAIAPHAGSLITLSIGVMLISFFLVINRKGALSQVLGILSLENGIVAFSIGAGLESNPGLLLGITFDIMIWIMIASIFISMLYRQFGTLDVTQMKRLTDL